jgi:hypothetical protein
MEHFHTIAKSNYAKPIQPSTGIDKACITDVCGLKSVHLLCETKYIRIPQCVFMSENEYLTIRFKISLASVDLDEKDVYTYTYELFGSGNMIIGVGSEIFTGIYKYIYKTEKKRYDALSPNIKKYAMDNLK